MADQGLIKVIQRLRLSGDELRRMTLWPDELIEDYLLIQDRFVTVAKNVIENSESTSQNADSISEVENRINLVYSSSNKSNAPLGIRLSFLIIGENSYKGSLYFLVFSC